MAVLGEGRDADEQRAIDARMQELRVARDRRISSGRTRSNRRVGGGSKARRRSRLVQPKATDLHPEETRCKKVSCKM